MREVLKNLNIGENTRQKLKIAICVLLFVLAMGVLTLVLLPHVKYLATVEGGEKFKIWVDSLGFWGWLISLGIQLLQIFIGDRQHFIAADIGEVLVGVVYVGKNCRKHVSQRVVYAFYLSREGALHI